MLKLALAQINSTVGDFDGNGQRILMFAEKAFLSGADVVVTPELSLAGYPPEDLLLREAFYIESRRALDALAQSLSIFPDLFVLVGCPLKHDGQCFNAAVLLCNGTIQGVYYKHILPNNDVFDEKRYFSSGKDAFTFRVKDTCLGVAICEDVWGADVAIEAKRLGAHILLVLNGSPFHMNKSALRYQVLRENVVSHDLAVVYVNLVGGQDELVFDGNSFVLDNKGAICAQLKHAEEDWCCIDFCEGHPSPSYLAPTLTIEAEIYQSLVLGVRDYITKNKFPGVLLGLSGGVDSALTLMIAVDALGVDKVRAVMMPSPYTADISLIDSRQMAAQLGVQYDELPIKHCMEAFDHILAEEFKGLPADKTEENIQARIRGILLMALSNKYGSIVLTTGNKSEMAVGYCTLYGDMAGGFAVLKDITKTWVYRLCHYRNQLESGRALDELPIPIRILTRPPSAELRANQIDQDTLPPYDVLDEIIRLYMEENYSLDDIIDLGHVESDVLFVVKLIKMNEYKRRQSPVGIRITHRAFGRDWRYPITSHFKG